MDEVALCGGFGSAVGEDAEPVAHARAAEMLDGESDLDRLRIGERSQVAAAGLDHEADRIAMLDVEQSRPDQPGVHGGVEPLIIDRVVDVAGGVVGGPARADLAPDALVRPRLRRLLPNAAS